MRLPRKFEVIPPSDPITIRDHCDFVGAVSTFQCFDQGEVFVCFVDLTQFSVSIIGSRDFDNFDSSASVVENEDVWFLFFVTIPS